MRETDAVHFLLAVESIGTSVRADHGHSGASCWASFRGSKCNVFFEPPFTGRITDVVRSCNCAKTSQSSRSCRHQEPTRPPRNCSSPHSNVRQHLPSEGPANLLGCPSQQRPSALLGPANQLGCPSQQRPSTLLKPDCSGSAKHITYPITPLSSASVAATRVHASAS